MAWCLVKHRDNFTFTLLRTVGKRPLGRPRHRWEDNIRVDLIEIGWEGVD